MSIAVLPVIAAVVSSLGSTNIESALSPRKFDFPVLFVTKSARVEAHVPAEVTSCRGDLNAIENAPNICDAPISAIAGVNVLSPEGGTIFRTISL